MRHGDYLYEGRQCETRCWNEWETSIYSTTILRQLSSDSWLARYTEQQDFLMNLNVFQCNSRETYVVVHVVSLLCCPCDHMVNQEFPVGENTSDTDNLLLYATKRQLRTMSAPHSLDIVCSSNEEMALERKVFHIILKEVKVYYVSTRRRKSSSFSANHSRTILSRSRMYTNCHFKWLLEFIITSSNGAFS